MSRTSYVFECPLCDSSASGDVREYVTKFSAEHMQDVHGGVYTAADDLAQAKVGEPE